MQLRSFVYLAFWGSMILLLSCNPARRLEKGKMRKRSSNYLLKKLDQNRVDADWFSGRAKVAFRGDGQSLRASANIRMRRDSVVWMNVKKLGIEAARVQITPDSVYILNRLSREYGAWDLSYLEREFNLPLGFNDLQELILGNAVMVNSDGLAAKVTEGKHRLSGQQAGVATEYHLNGLNFFLEKIIVSDPGKTWMVNIDQQEYGLEKDYAKFPYLRNFTIESEDTGSLGLNVKFSKIELNVPKSVKFEIPSRYTKMR